MSFKQIMFFSFFSKRKRKFEQRSKLSMSIKYPPTQLFLAAATCFAPTEKNSVMTSRGMPLVSGTFKKTNTHDITHTTAYMPKTPARPTDLSSTGSEYVTMMSQIQNVSAHIAMQMPRTRVGKISAQSMLGIGPNPMTKKQK